MNNLCTPTDLEQHSDPRLLGLLFDDVNTPPVWDDGAKALAQMYCTEATAYIETKLAGRVDLSDPVVAAQLKRIAAVLALHMRWGHRGKTERANPMRDAWKSAEAELDEIIRGERKVGAAEEPSRPAYAAGGGQPSVFGPDSDGVLPSVTRDW